MTEERTEYTTQPDELTQLRTENWNLRQQLDRQIAAWNANGDALTAHAARQAQRIAELEADIAQLRKELNGAGQIVRACEAERRALAAQLAAVPVDALRVVVKDVPASGYHTGNPMNTAVTEVRNWLNSLDGAA